MTCAPRGISSTYSASVGRTAVRRAPRVVRTVTPSGCADEVVVLEHAGVGVELPALDERHQVTAALGVDEQHAVACRESRATVSPSVRSGWARSCTATVSPAAFSRSRQNAQTSPGSVPERTAPRRRGRRAAHAALAELVAFVLGVPANRSCPRSRKPNRNAAFVPGERVLEPVEHLLVAEVPVARGHRALLDLVVDAAQHAVGRGLALAEPHERLHLAHEPGRRGQHGVLAAEVAGVPAEHVAEQDRGLVVEVVAGGDDVVAAARSPTR